MTFFKKIIEYLAIVLAFLIVRVFVWVPLVYCVGYLIAARIYGFTVSDTAATFMLGLLLACSLSVLLAFRSYIIKPFRNAGASKDRAALQRSKYITDAANSVKAEGAPNINPAPIEPVLPETLQDKPSHKDKNQMPKLYRTYSDPNIIIAEFPDRLEYYKKTPMGIIYLETEYL